MRTRVQTLETKVRLCNPCPGKGGTGGSLGLEGQLIYLTEQDPGLKNEWVGRWARSGGRWGREKWNRNILYKELFSIKYKVEQLRKTTQCHLNWMHKTTWRDLKYKLLMFSKCHSHLESLHTNMLNSRGENNWRNSKCQDKSWVVALRAAPSPHLNPLPTFPGQSSPAMGM